MQATTAVANNASENRAVSVGVSLRPQTLNKIDEERADLSRSLFVRRILEAHFESKERQPRK